MNVQEPFILCHTSIGRYSCAHMWVYMWMASALYSSDKFCSHLNITPIHIALALPLSMHDIPLSHFLLTDGSIPPFPVSHLGKRGSPWGVVVRMTGTPLPRQDLLHPLDGQHNLLLMTKPWDSYLLQVLPLEFQNLVHSGKTLCQ